jgi:hypothetical protein
MSLSGLPHSEILGSKPVCGSPKLIAAYHVLHRLLAPRHSPYALSSLTIVLELEANAYRASRLAVRDSTHRTENRELRIAACDSSLTHCMCCGRKKLPFAGYSIVKERRNLSGISGASPLDQLPILRSGGFPFKRDRLNSLPCAGPPSMTRRVACQP